VKIVDLALMRLTPFPCNCKLTSLNFVKISVDCDSQDSVSMTPFASHLCAARGAQTLFIHDNYPSAPHYMPKLSRTLLNPLVSFDQSIN